MSPDLGSISLDLTLSHPGQALDRNRKNTSIDRSSLVVLTCIMPQSLSNVLVHAIWSTKDRHPFLVLRPLRDELHRYLGGISTRLDCPTLIVGGVADHVHVLMRLARTITMADWVKEMKRASTVWLIDQTHRDPMLSKFHWQSGYGAFSVSESRVGDLCTYIATQEKHHAKHSFQDEYRRFLQAHSIKWDELHVWS